MYYHFERVVRLRDKYIFLNDFRRRGKNLMVPSCSRYRNVGYMTV